MVILGVNGITHGFPHTSLAVDTDCQLRLKLQLLTIMSVCVFFQVLPFPCNVVGDSTDTCRGRAQEKSLLLTRSLRNHTVLIKAATTASLASKCWG